MRKMLTLLMVGLFLTAVPGCKCGREAGEDPSGTLEEVSGDAEEGDPGMMDQTPGEGSDQSLGEIPAEPPDAEESSDGAGLPDEDSND